MGRSQVRGTLPRLCGETVPERPLSRAGKRVAERASDPDAGVECASPHTPRPPQVLGSQKEDQHPGPKSGGGRRRCCSSISSRRLEP